MREPAIYNAVITAIATGSSKMNEISNKIDENTSVCTTYIKNLISLGIIKKESPYGEKSTRKTIYTIEDNLRSTIEWISASQTHKDKECTIVVTIKN